jgi:shikimate kinase
VLATGGGAFIQPATRALVREAAVSLWLRAELDVVWDRVKGKTGRPLLANPDPRGTLERLIASRYPVYALADVTVDSLASERHEAAAERIVEALRARDAGLPPGERLFGEPEDAGQRSRSA